MAWLQILAVTLVVFVLQQSVPGFNTAFSFNPQTAFSAPWTFITSIFMHGGVTHLFFNMLALFSFGPLLERRIGEGKFYLIYFLAGIIGNLAFIFFYPNSTGVGASGAIFGMIGALAILMPNVVIIVYFVPMPMWLAAIAWGVLEFLLSGAPDSIARFVHIAGLLVGLAAGIWIKQNEPAYFVHDY